MSPTSTSMAQSVVVHACDEDDAGLGTCGESSAGGAWENEEVRKLFTSPSSESEPPELDAVAVDRPGCVATGGAAVAAAPGIRPAQANVHPKKWGASLRRMPTHVAQRPPPAHEQEQHQDEQEASPRVTEGLLPAHDEQQPTPPHEQDQHNSEEEDR